MELFTRQKNRTIRMAGEAYFYLALLGLGETLLLIFMSTQMGDLFKDPSTQEFFTSGSDSLPFMSYMEFVITHFTEVILFVSAGALLTLTSSVLFLKGKKVGRWGLLFINLIGAAYSFYWAFMSAEYYFHIDSLNETAEVQSMISAFMIISCLLGLACGFFYLWINKKLSEDSVKKALS